MGIAYDTGKCFDYVLVTDRDKPEGEQPKYRFRFLSARDYTKVSEVFADALKVEGGDAAFAAKVVEGLRLCMVGWESVKDFEGKPVPFDANEIDAVLSIADLSELRGNVLAEMTLKEVEKKHSAFAALSTTAPSAEAKTA